MKMPRVILVVRFYAKAPNTYTSDDILTYIPFKDERGFGEYKRERGLSVKVIGEETETIDSVRVKVYHAESVSKVFRKAYEEGVPLADMQIARGVYERVRKQADQKRVLKSKKEGYVNYKYPVSRKEIEGSLTFMLTPKVKEYIKEPKGVFGYLGHEGRKHHMDEYIEYTIMRVLDYTRKRGITIGVIDLVAEWMCSSDGRHWMDKAENCNKTEFKRLFKNKLVSILAQERERNGITEETIKGIKKHLG